MVTELFRVFSEDITKSYRLRNFQQAFPSLAFNLGEKDIAFDNCYLYYSLYFGMKMQLFGSDCSQFLDVSLKDLKLNVQFAFFF